MTKFKDIIKNIDKPLFILTLILFVLGLVMIFSASNVTSYMNGGSPYAYFLRQGLFLIVSFIFCIIILINSLGCKVKGPIGIQLTA